MTTNIKHSKKLSCCKETMRLLHGSVSATIQLEEHILHRTWRDIIGLVIYQIRWNDANKSYDAIQTHQFRYQSIAHMWLPSSNLHPISYCLKVIANYCSNFGGKWSLCVGDRRFWRGWPGVSVLAKISGWRGRPPPFSQSHSKNDDHFVNTKVSVLLPAKCQKLSKQNLVKVVLCDVLCLRTTAHLCEETK